MKIKSAALTVHSEQLIFLWCYQLEIDVAIESAVVSQCVPWFGLASYVGCKKAEANVYGLASVLPRRSDYMYLPDS